MLKTVFLGCLIYFQLACAYVPVTKPPLIKDEQCQLISKELELEEKQLTSGGSCSGAACSALLIIPATTFVVSGSIVLIGNSLHWLEKNGTCNDGIVKKNLTDFIEWAFNSGGQAISP